MSRELSLIDQAYNACVDVINSKQAEVTKALEEYNRAVRASHELNEIKLFEELKLVPKNTGTAF